MPKVQSGAAGCFEGWKGWSRYTDDYFTPQRLADTGPAKAFSLKQREVCMGHVQDWG